MGCRSNVKPHGNMDSPSPSHAAYPFAVTTGQCVRNCGGMLGAGGINPKNPTSRASCAGICHVQPVQSARVAGDQGRLGTGGCENRQVSGAREVVLGLAGETGAGRREPRAAAGGVVELEQQAPRRCSYTTNTPITVLYALFDQTDCCETEGNNAQPGRISTSRQN